MIDDALSVVKSLMSSVGCATAKAFIGSQLPPNATVSIASAALTDFAAFHTFRGVSMPYVSLSQFWKNAEPYT